MELLSLRLVGAIGARINVSNLYKYPQRGPAVAQIQSQVLKLSSRECELLTKLIPVQRFSSEERRMLFCFCFNLLIAVQGRGGYTPH